MRTLVLSALALGALTSAALAETANRSGPFGSTAAQNLTGLANTQAAERTYPAELTDEQMDGVRAGSPGGKFGGHIGSGGIVGGPFGPGGRFGEPPGPGGPCGGPCS